VEAVTIHARSEVAKKNGQRYKWISTLPVEIFMRLKLLVDTGRLHY